MVEMSLAEGKGQTKVRVSKCPESHRMLLKSDISIPKIELEPRNLHLIGCCGDNDVDKLWTTP